MVKTNSLFLLLILVVLEMIYYVRAIRVPDYDFDGDDEFQISDRCIKKIINENNTDLPTFGVRYKDRVMEIGEEVVTYPLNNPSQPCKNPIKTYIKACDLLIPPSKYSFDVKTNTLHIVRNVMVAKLFRGCLQVFQTCK